MADKKEKLDFEHAMERLEQIVRKLETGKTTLEESIELYTEGVKLVKTCGDELKKAESKVKMLTIGEEGVTETDFK